MRRTVRRIASLSGNGILGIRREDKNVWERRTPLTPAHVKKMLEKQHVKEVVVQPSTIRCYSDEEYAEVGATINEDLSKCGTIVAVKEVPAQKLLPDRTYMFFSHTIKAQSYNMPLLDTIVNKNIRLLDYERILGPDGRIVKFGPYAGFAGMVDTLHALGQALLLKGFATPFLHLSLSKEYRSLESARTDLDIMGALIRKRGLPKAMSPLVFAVTGAGAVSLAAQQMLHYLPCKYVDVDELPKLYKRTNIDNHSVYVCVVRAKDMVEPVSAGKSFSSEDYYKHPENYRPVFHERVAPYIHVLVTGHYWEPRFPRLLSLDQARDLHHKGRLPLIALGDITCDIGGSIEFFEKATTIQNPFYAYDIPKRKIIDIQDYTGDGVVILGVDHLPAEFPCESSTDFGDGLWPLLKKVSSSPDTESLDEQKKSLGDEVYKSMVTCRGKITPNFEYIMEMRKAREESKARDQKKRVVVFGAGMTAGPAVEYLLANKNNSVTVVDANAAQVNALIRKFGHHKFEDLSGEDTNTARPAVANAGVVDDYLMNIIKRSDIIVSMLPAPMHANIAKAAIATQTPMLTASYINPNMEELRSAAEAAGVPIVNEMGLDPGIDIMTSAKMIARIRAEGGKITKYVSLCGALPQPENSDGPMGYKFSWSPRGVLTAASRPTRFRVAGKWFDVPGKYLYHLTQGITMFRGLDLFWVPNGFADKYAKIYGLRDDEADTVVRGTLRYAHFAPTVRAFQELDLLNETESVPELEASSTTVVTWANFLRARVGCQPGAPLQAALAEVLGKKISKTRSELQSLEAYKALNARSLIGGTPASPLPLDEEVSQILVSMEAIGLLSEDVIVPKTESGTVLDSLCSQMLKRMSYNAFERDFVLMLHRICATFPDGTKKTYVATLAKRGLSDDVTATALTVGLPVGATAQLMLDGGLKNHKGLVIPTDPAVYEPVLAALAKQDIEMRETVEVHTE